jgi:hypothetical protein
MARVNDKKLWKVFSEYIRRRDSNGEGYGKCFTCPRVIHWKNGDCGHGIGRQHLGTKYDEKNNHLQCKHCNGFEGGKRDVYKEEMNKRYGPNTWDLMELKSRQVSKMGSFEIEQLTEYYKNKIKELDNGSIKRSKVA